MRGDPDLIVLLEILLARSDASSPICRARAKSSCSSAAVAAKKMKARGAASVKPRSGSLATRTVRSACRGGGGARGSTQSELDQAQA